MPFHVGVITETYDKKFVDYCIDILNYVRCILLLSLNIYIEKYAVSHILLIAHYVKPVVP